MRRFASGWTSFVLVTLAALSMGAEKNNGCSAEHSRGDYRSNEWDIGRIPSPVGAPRPMTCAWLVNDNCWKRVAQAALDCAPADEGRFVNRRQYCAYDDGSLLEWEAPVSTPAPGVDHRPWINHRILDDAGEPCFTSIIQGVAHAAFRAGGETVVIQAESLTTFRVICQDGSTYSSAVEGSCPDIGSMWLGGRTPGYEVICDGTTEVCRAELKGAAADSATATLTTCGW